MDNLNGDGSKHYEEQVYFMESSQLRRTGRVRDFERKKKTKKDVLDNWVGYINGNGHRPKLPKVKNSDNQTLITKGHF